VVVNVEGKGAAGPRQATTMKTNASKPLKTSRKPNCRRRNRAGTLARDRTRKREPVSWSSGVRDRGGVSMVEARVRNVGGLHLDDKGALPDGGPIKEQSTEARTGVGAAHSSEELGES